MNHWIQWWKECVSDNGRIIDRDISSYFVSLGCHVALIVALALWWAIPGPGTRSAPPTTFEMIEPLAEQADPVDLEIVSREFVFSDQPHEKIGAPADSPGSASDSISPPQPVDPVNSALDLLGSLGPGGGEPGAGNIGVEHGDMPTQNDLLGFSRKMNRSQGLIGTGAGGLRFRGTGRRRHDRRRWCDRSANA